MKHISGRTWSSGCLSASGQFGLHPMPSWVVSGLEPYLSASEIILSPLPYIMPTLIDNSSYSTPPKYLA